MDILKGKIAIVTGAGRGIGRAIAERFVSEGAIVYALDVCVDGNTKLSDSDSSGVLITQNIDITDFTAVKNLVVSIRKEHGKIDVLVNNAGLISYELMSFIDFERFRKMLDVNVVALVNMMQLCARIMMRQSSGSIINMASIVGEKGAKGQLSYSASKGAVIAVTKSAAKELAEYKIRVNAIAPGMVGTERFKAVLEEKMSDKINAIPFGRLAEPEDIASCCLFLASDMSLYITGQILGVDGGVNI